MKILKTGMFAVEAVVCLLAGTDAQTTPSKSKDTTKMSKADHSKMSTREHELDQKMDRMSIGKRNDPKMSSKREEDKLKKKGATRKM